MALDGAVNLSTTQDGAGRQPRRLRERARHVPRRVRQRLRLRVHSGGDPRRALDDLRARFEGGLVLESADGRSAGVSEFYTTLLAALDQRGSGRSSPTRSPRPPTVTVTTCARSPICTPAVATTARTTTSMRPSAPSTAPTASTTASPSTSTARRSTGTGSTFRSSDRSSRASRWDATPGSRTAGRRAARRRTSSEGLRRSSIIGTTEDPATPYEGAKDLRRRLRGSRLLTFEATQHGAYGQGVGLHRRRREPLSRGPHLPARGTRCTEARRSARSTYARARAGTPRHARCPGSCATGCAARESVHRPRAPRRARPRPARCPALPAR